MEGLYAAVEMITVSQLSLLASGSCLHQHKNLLTQKSIASAALMEQTRMQREGFSSDSTQSAAPAADAHRANQTRPTADRV